MVDTYRPPEGAAVAAKRALRWIKEGHAGSGFTDVGRKRASQLANREALTLDTVKRMYSYFSRHEVDKDGKDFDNLTKPSPGRVAWDAWGGDAGYSWARRIVESAGEEKMVIAEAHIFVPIQKFDKNDDGTLLVRGIATDSSLDSDEQVCDEEWLKSAMPSWFRWGNIREQHSNIAAGVATEYEERDGRHWITALVTDSNSAKKVETKTLKGFSIGIARPRVIKDEKAAGGRIVDGEIVEISLVDRPANPTCMLSLAKAVNGSLVKTEQFLTKGQDTVSAESSAPPKKEESSTAPAEESTAAPAAEESTASKAAEESSQKPGEESSQKPGEESSRPGGVAGVAGKAEECPHCGEALAKISDLVTMMYDKMCGPDKEAADKSQSEDIAKALKEVEARVSDIEKTAASVVAPVRTAVGSPKAETVNANAVKAKDYRAKAMAATDQRLAEGYLALAVELEKSL